MKDYFKNISSSVTSLLKGLKITLDHFFKSRTMRDPIPVFDDKYFDKQEGIVTLQYPFEEIPVPDNGRYKLHNEIDDCIVCDKCAKVCPVNCIDIEPVRAVEEIGKTSDGTPKRIYAAKFDIDMSKCCFCGLCTTVCPTECLTMSKEYDFSVLDIKEHNFEFSEMEEPEIDLRKEELEVFNEQKAKAKAEAAAKPKEPSTSTPKTGFKPKVKTSESDAPKKAVFKPKVKTALSSEAKPNVEETEKTASSKPAFKPKIKVKPKTVEAEEKLASDHVDQQEITPKPSKPIFKPKIKVKPKTEEGDAKDSVTKESGVKAKPVFKPKIKAKKTEESADGPDQQSEKESQETGNATLSKTDGEEVKKKPVFRPKIKPKKQP